MTYYFIKDGDNELGPYTIEQLKSRLINKDTPVWFLSLKEWTVAGHVHELKELFTAKTSNTFSKDTLNKMWENNTFRQQLKKFLNNSHLIKRKKIYRSQTFTSAATAVSSIFKKIFSRLVYTFVNK